MPPSSPPQVVQRPASPTDSQYSLDLSALEHSTPSKMELPRARVDHIFSEEIDGPSDFTQNMEMWMRAGHIPKYDSLTESPIRNVPVQKITEDHAQGDTPDAQLTDLQQELQEEPVATLDERTGSRHSLENSPHIEAVADNVMSERSRLSGQTYTASPTSLPPPPKPLLQPTVEDYYSEVTPAHLPTELAIGERGAEFPAATQRIASPHRDLQDHEPADVEMQLRELRAKCQQLGQLNDALQLAIDEERRLRRQDKMQYDSRIARAVCLEKDMRDKVDSARRENENLEYDLVQTKARLQALEMDEETAKKADARAESDLKAELLHLREVMEQERIGHKKAIGILENDMKISRSRRHDAEESVRIQNEELRDLHEGHNVEMERLRTELQQSQLDEAAIADLEKRLGTAHTEIEQLRANDSEAQNLHSSFREQIAKLKNANEKENTRAAADRVRALELASGLQRQFRDLRQQMSDDQAAHASEIERIRSESHRTAQISADELEIVRAELESKQAELNDAILERDEAQDTMQAREWREEALMRELDDMKAVSAELDATISEKLQRRESHWKTKLEQINHERQLMTKALLHQWGKEEVGVDSPQTYAYRYNFKTDTPRENVTKTKLAA